MLWLVKFHMNNLNISNEHVFTILAGVHIKAIIVNYNLKVGVKFFFS